MTPTTTPHRNRLIALASILLLCLGVQGSAATGTLMPSPFQTLLDANGNPVSNGKVCTYVAGTTTPATTYTDVGLLVANANPIRTDPSGRFVVYLTPGASYKFVYQDSSGTVGICDGASIKTVDNVLAVPSTANPTTDLSIVNLRLSLTSGTAVTPSDVTAATTIYAVLYQGNRIALYDGATWNLRALAANSPITVPATTSTMYDVFCYDNNTVPTFETLAWTNDTTRATVLTTQDGVLAKSGDATRRYLGSFRTTTVSGQTESSDAKRYLWNYYNRVPLSLKRYETTSSWTYTTATVRQANGAVANQVEVVIGIAEVALDVSLTTMMANTNASVFTGSGIGEDSTTTYAAGAIVVSALAGAYTPSTSRLVKYPAIGRHFYSWNEYSQATGTTTWLGANVSGGSTSTGGLSGRIEG